MSRHRRFSTANSFARSTQTSARTFSSRMWEPRVRSRKCVWNPSNRILIPTVRKVAPWARARKNTFRATSRIVDSTFSQSVTSLSNVRSTLIDFGSGRSSTGSSSTPRAIAQSQIEFFPISFLSSAPGNRASSPIVRTPTPSRTCAVFGPTPLIFGTGRGSRKVVTSSGRTTLIPSGFAMSEAIFAMDLLGAAPIVQASPSRSRTAAFTGAALTALRVGSDDHGLSDQIGILPPFHADVEGVHVHVEDDARHGWPSPSENNEPSGAGGSLDAELIAFGVQQDDPVL